MIVTVAACRPPLTVLTAGAPSADQCQATRGIDPVTTRRIDPPGGSVLALGSSVAFRLAVKWSCRQLPGLKTGAARHHADVAYDGNFSRID